MGRHRAAAVEVDLARDHFPRLADIGRSAAERLLQDLAGDTSPAQSSWLGLELVTRSSVRQLNEE